jgi:hypothetical protein
MAVAVDLTSSNEEMLHKQLLSTRSDMDSSDVGRRPAQLPDPANSAIARHRATTNAAQDGRDVPVMDTTALLPRPTSNRSPTPPSGDVDVILNIWFHPQGNRFSPSNSLIFYEVASEPGKFY